MGITQNCHAPIAYETDGTRIAYPVADAAKAIGISRAFLYKLLTRGEIPARKIGNKTVIASADLRDFVARAPRARFSTQAAA